MIRVLLADDHSTIRMGLEQLLSDETDFEVVGSAPDGSAAVSLADAVNPDVVLMDLSMPVMDGVEATRRIMAAHPEMRVVVFTSYAERDRVIDAIDAGATGYLLKDGEPEDLVRGIRAAARGDVPLSPKAARAVLAARFDRRQAEVLTRREREVLVLAANGLVNKQIARRLTISEKTVKAHLTNIFQRLGVTDRTQATLWAERHGLLAAPLE